VDHSLPAGLKSPEVRVTPFTFPGPALPVWLAATPRRAGAKESLLAALWRRLALQEGLPAGRCPTLHQDHLGRPYLLTAPASAAISFSHCQGHTWAALARSRRLGLDVASPLEFRPPYPYGRAFRAAELQLLREAMEDSLPVLAALLWALKEASVKVLVCGFHLFDPLTVVVGRPRRLHQGWLFQVRAVQPVPVYARPQGDGWMALACLG